MDKEEIAREIRRIINGDLDDVERAVKADNKARALSDLDDAVTKLRRLIARL